MVNQYKKSSNPNYCVRVTANDGEIGEQFLREFQDNEKLINLLKSIDYKENCFSPAHFCKMQDPVYLEFVFQNPVLCRCLEKFSFQENRGALIVCNRK